jgi:hypothetical protein
MVAEHAGEELHPQLTVDLISVPAVAKHVGEEQHVIVNGCPHFRNSSSSCRACRRRTTRNS